MKQLNLLFNSCADDLRVIRSQLPNNLEPGTRALLDSVILRYEQGLGAIDDAERRRVFINDFLALLTRFFETLFAISGVLDRLTK
jgi:hypothetical protein